MIIINKLLRVSALALLVWVEVSVTLVREFLFRTGRPKLELEL